jgi:hypothetical protein
MSVKNITNFINQIKRTGTKKGFENYFRGHSNSDFKLEPSIYRDGYINNEDRIFKESIIRIPQEFSSYKTTIEKLVKMQHYGVPTRLLDVTSNPLVALFFACNKDFDKEGEVIFLQIPQDHIRFYDSDTVSILANIAKRPKNFEYDYLPTTKISEFNESHHIGYLLHEIKEEKPYFQDKVEHFYYLEFVEIKQSKPMFLGLGSPINQAKS